MSYCRGRITIIAMDSPMFAPPTPERLVCAPEPVRHRRKNYRPRQRNPVTGHWVLDNVSYSSTGKPIFFYKWWDAIMFDDGQVGWVIEVNEDEEMTRFPPPATPVIVPHNLMDWEQDVGPWV